MPDARLVAAVLAGKAAASASRRLRRGAGATVPGDVALGIDPAALRKIGSTLEQGAVLVTGTNGKTTTSGLLVSALRADGRRVVTNDTGANLIFGLCAAAVADAGVLGHARSHIGVFEVDELWLERAVTDLRPRMVVVLNLFRDQLDRAGELHSTAAAVGRALRRLPDGAHIVANVDDPLAAAQVDGLAAVVGFGVEDAAQALPALPHAADARACPRCGAPLLFDRVMLGHCGSYRCPACGFGRPEPQFAVRHIDAPAVDGLRLTVGDGAELDARVGGVYNAYNVVAAYAACRTLGLGSADAASGLRAFRARFGRQETIRLFGRPMRMLLAKNPTGFDEVLRTADELGDTDDYLIAVNDGIADGRDVSWLWDVDFERLARSPRRPRVVAAGRRAHDLALRLKYAGLPDDRVAIEPDAEAALRRLAADGAGGTATVIPTYTAMLELRAVAERAGAVAAVRAGASSSP